MTMPLRPDAGHRIERALTAAIQYGTEAACPPKLAAAMHHAVFPGGARVRPRLTLAVAHACGEDAPTLTDAAAAAVELLHCASLVHDDLPVFDDAASRRGRPSVHAMFGAPVALLAGDALIVHAMETVARAAVQHPARIAPLVLALSAGTGAAGGIAAGQAWESEAEIDPSAYRAAKTGALFVSAVAAGAIAAGADPGPWRGVGARLGDAYQVADDVLDQLGNEQAGKPAGQDARHGRPNAVLSLGMGGAMRLLRELVEATVASVPDVPGASELRDLVRLQAVRLVPAGIARSAA